MNKLEKFFWVIMFSVLNFVFLTSVEKMGQLIGFEYMENVGIALLLGVVTVRILADDSNRENKEE